MTYTITDFKALRETWSTWSALKEYLQSDAGGALGVREFDGGRRALIHYRKGISDMSVSHTRWFRSVIWDTATNMPVCISTPKAIDENAAGGNVFEWSAADVASKSVQEYLEGVTLNLYKDASGTVQVSSRTCVGAGRGFYNTVSFRSMLNDAIRACGHDQETVEDFFGALVQAPNQFLTVLVQHPAHRVVVKVETPRVHVLQRGHVSEDGSVYIEEMCQAGLETPALGETVAEWFERLVQTHGWSWQGVVIHGAAGERWRIRSSVYHMIRSLRGSTNRVDERFFGLRAAGLIKTYLQYYPEESNTFREYEKWLRSMTNQLFSFYVAVYKARSVQLAAVDKRWHTHLAALHRIYLTTRKPTGHGLLMSDAVNYVNSLPVPRILFLMNYEHRVGNQSG